MFLSHEVIGLFDGGYEYLLSAAMLTSVKVSDLRCRHHIEHLTHFSLSMLDVLSLGYNVSRVFDIDRYAVQHVTYRAQEAARRTDRDAQGN